MSDYLMQAVDDSNAQLYTWTSASPDFAGATFPGPGDAIASTVAIAGRVALSAAEEGDLNAPIDPDDDGKVAVASGGDLTYVGGTAVGQVLRLAAGNIPEFGALDLTDGDALTGLLPLARLTGGSAVGQVLRNTAGNVPAWGALDLGDLDAITGVLDASFIGGGSDGQVITWNAGNASFSNSLITNAIGTTSGAGLSLVNTTDAAAGAQQNSPLFRLKGEGWKTDATAGTQDVEWGIQCLPVQGAANPTPELHLLSSVNGAAFTSRAKFTDTAFDAGALNVITTGYAALGASPAVTGDLRVKYNWTWKGNNAATGTDIQIFRWYRGINGDTDNSIDIGETNVARSTLAAGGLRLNIFSDQGYIQLTGVGQAHFELSSNLLTCQATTWTVPASQDTTFLFNLEAGDTQRIARFRGRGASSGNNNGSPIEMLGGRPQGTGTPGSVRLSLNQDDSTPQPMIEVVEVADGQRAVALAFGANITTTQLPANTGDRVVFLADAATAPTANPVSGLLLYGLSGSLRGRSSTGDFVIGAHTSTNGHLILMGGGVSDTAGNIGLLATASTWQSMQRGLWLSDATAEPTGNPTGGPFLWSTGRRLRARTNGLVADVVPEGNGVTRYHVDRLEGVSTTSVSEVDVLSIDVGTDYSSDLQFSGTVNVHGTRVSGGVTSTASHCGGLYYFSLRQSAAGDDFDFTAISDPGTDIGTWTATYSAGVIAVKVTPGSTAEIHWTAHIIGDGPAVEVTHGA